MSADFQSLEVNGCASQIGTRPRPLLVERFYDQEEFGGAQRPVRQEIAAINASENRPRLKRAPLFLTGRKPGNLKCYLRRGAAYRAAPRRNLQKPTRRLKPAIYSSNQSPLASASRSHADRKFSYHVSVKLVMTCSAVRPAIFTPE